MDFSLASQGFAAMGSEARLLVLKTLVRAGDDSLTVGEIQERTGIPPSTLAHHLKFLAAAGLIEQIREGRSTLNKACLPELAELGQYIMSQCCQDLELTPARKAANVV